MVDILGRQDHGSQPGTETPETVVSCDRNNGEFMALRHAQKSYLPYACNPNSHGNIGQCPHQKPCLELRLHMQQAEVLRTEQKKGDNRSGMAVSATEAFRYLPTGNQQFQSGRNDHGKEKW